jgi:TIR domain
MAEVFISYSQKDRALVAPIATRLAEVGVDAWFDREISAGERFAAVIRAKLKEAKAVLACWSPDAVQSDWVEAEADYARELGTYVPVFVARCSLMPPFNRIHTDDLSKWTGEPSDPTWIKLVERIAKVIGREGVAAAARAVAAGDEQSQYDFARQYPDEPTARKIWKGFESGHREDFARRMAEAKNVADERIVSERAAVEACLEEVASAFEIWLRNERRAAADGPMPDPIALIGQNESPRLRHEIDSLRRSLAQAKAKERELDGAKSEITGLTQELRAALGKAKATDGDLLAAKSETRRMSRELDAALEKAKAANGDLLEAKVERAMLSEELADFRRRLAENQYYNVSVVGQDCQFTPVRHARLTKSRS